jgi:hypothetical protein
LNRQSSATRNSVLRSGSRQSAITISGVTAQAKAQMLIVVRRSISLIEHCKHLRTTLE